MKIKSAFYKWRSRFALMRVENTIGVLGLGNWRSRFDLVRVGNAIGFGDMRSRFDLMRVGKWRSTELPQS